LESAPLGPFQVVERGECRLGEPSGREDVAADGVVECGECAM
jgi:hypothetical protein